MNSFKVTGGNRIDGSIKLQGAKNSALPILAATLLIKNKSVIHNCPDLSDVDAALKILVKLGCVCVRDENTVIVDSTDAFNYEVGKELAGEMRSSIVFLGAIIARMGKAVISSPGGCELGPRPIDMHLSALKQLGVIIKEEDGVTSCNCPNGLVGGEIYLRFPSVGATENIIIAACLARGKTVIHGAASEPEISDLADFLNRAGARIKGAGSNTVIIEGVPCLKSVEHTVMSDRIVAATFLSAAAVTGGSIEITDCPAYNMQSILDFFEKIGCYMKIKNNRVYMKCPSEFKASGVTVTDVYPAFPTDAGPLIVATFSRLPGENSLLETIFENRFRYVPELNKLGADICQNGKTVTSKGKKKLFGADVNCTDLRGGAALVIAALNAEGESVVNDIYHIERGYQSFALNLKKLGVDIEEL
ncbi:MAG: UDP-N-acetylglucosamine 1-carboxyvinyltransferase [Ruminococcaceae bacterium]|nr:UDP-N-acetylglucosamine 1-carboxyvinyltransferase [Oscillospiraceae bacterium]